MTVMEFARTPHRWFEDGIFRRIFRNASLLLGGRATTGLLGLGTLSLSAHGLGAQKFGVLVLVQTFVQMIAALITFQSWQAVIRYGAMSLENNDTRALQNLIKFTTLLDFSGGILGTVLGWCAAPLVGPLVGWSPDVVAAAQPYSLLVLFTMVATPTGLLRLFDRFDLLAAQTIVTPLLRLIGITAAAILHAPFWAYLVAWFVAGAAGGAVLAFLGWREAFRRGHLSGFDFSLIGIVAPHPGIARFAIASSLNASLQVVTGQMSVFLVGLLAGPTAAGLFMVGREVATALSGPAELLNQSVYPEFARLGSRGRWKDFATLVLRGGAFAGMGGLIMFTLTAAFGDTFIDVFFGPSFAGAYLPLVLLVAAAGLSICGFPMDPALYAMGRPGISLRINTTVIVAIYLPLLVILTRDFGPSGAGGAMLAATACTFFTMALFTTGQLRRYAVATQ